jgi:cation diffusion facilitator family transporter
VNKAKAAYVEGIVSIAANAALFALKLWAGMVTASIALYADAWHTLSDSISSIIVVAAVSLSSKKPDKEHPFGHGRWEQLAAIFIAFILGFIAFEFLTDSIARFMQREQAPFGTLALVVTIISIVVKEVLAQTAFYIGRKTDNIAVRADGWHHRTDALSSVIVLVGILVAKQFWWIDSALGVIIAVMLFLAAFSIIKENVTKLLGETPDDALIEKITAEVRGIYDKDLKLHHFHIHNYILHKELTMHIKIDKDMTIEVGYNCILTSVLSRIFLPRSFTE